MPYLTFHGEDGRSFALPESSCRIWEADQSCGACWDADEVTVVREWLIDAGPHGWYRHRREVDGFDLVGAHPPIHELPGKADPIDPIDALEWLRDNGHEIPAELLQQCRPPTVTPWTEADLSRLPPTAARTLRVIGDRRCVAVADLAGPVWNIPAKRLTRDQVKKACSAIAAFLEPLGLSIHRRGDHLIIE